MHLITLNGQSYPAFQAESNAAQFTLPFAKKICLGEGYDIGCGKLEWALPGSMPIDLVFEDPFDAMNLPDEMVDYVFSSHCLEHLDDWVEALMYWTTKIKHFGSIFLYLPHYDQEYWRPWNLRKHKHVLTSEIVSDCLWNIGYTKIFSSERDLNHSFTVIGEKGLGAA